MRSINLIGVCIIHARALSNGHQKESHAHNFIRAQQSIQTIVIYDVSCSCKQFLVGFLLTNCIFPIRFA